MDESKKMLEEEIQEEIRNLSALTNGSDEKGAAIDDLTKLYKLKVEETKILKEEEAGKRQLLEQKLDRYCKLGIEAAGVILPLIFYGTWMRRGFKFEETGTFTSTTFKGLFSRFKPTKK